MGRQILHLPCKSLRAGQGGCGMGGEQNVLSTEKQQQAVIRDRASAYNLFYPFGIDIRPEDSQWLLHAAGIVYHLDGGKAWLGGLALRVLQIGGRAP